MTTANHKILDTLNFCRETGHLPDGSRACLLCADTCPDEAMPVGVWVPIGESLQRRLGCSEERLSSGGARVIVYQLCPACFDGPNREEDVEAEILKRAGVH
jgi:hypothetical protein